MLERLEALERQARQRAEEERQAPDPAKPVCMKRDRKRRHPPDVPKPTEQRNFTDPESRIMKDTTTKGFIQGYNAQVAVDAKAQVIVAAEVTDQRFMILQPNFDCFRYLHGTSSFS